jgi:RDD family
MITAPQITAPHMWPPLYARFSRRFRGILLDWIIAIAVIYSAIFVAITVGNDVFSRALACVVIVGLLLYEPVLVSATGGTLGHYFNNLRVVDEQSGGNVSFLKACVRLVIKGLLGWCSFAILAATRRNQAVHDLVTRSTVQIRDVSRVRPGQYITERVELADARLPSRPRRTAIVCVYLLLLFVVFEVAATLLATTGIVSPRCIENDICSGGKRVFDLGADVALVVLMAAVITFGWKGRLFGARRRA